MKCQINIAGYQIVLRKRLGRPKKTILKRLEEYFNYLKRVFRDNRFAGHPLSRVFRRVFELKKIRQFLGFNLVAVTLISGTFSSGYPALQNNEAEITKVSSQIVELSTQTSIRFPVDDPKISQGFSSFHKAVDFAQPYGSPVYPISEGIVERVSYQRFGYGNYLVVDHGSGFKSLYAHFSKIIAKEGQEVDKNTVIGLIGSSGWATGPHLHLEVYEDGQLFNPLIILK